MTPLLFALPEFISVAQNVGFELFFVFLPGADSFISFATIKYLANTSPVFFSQLDNSYSKFIKSCKLAVILTFNHSQIIKIMSEAKLDNISCFGVTISNKKYKFSFPYCTFISHNSDKIKNLIGVFDLPNQPALWSKYFERVFSKIVRFFTTLHNKNLAYLSNSIIQNNSFDFCDFEDVIQIISKQEQIISHLNLYNFKHLYQYEECSKLEDIPGNLENFDLLLFTKYYDKKRIKSIFHQNLAILLKAIKIVMQFKLPIFMFYNVMCQNVKNITNYSKIFIELEKSLNEKQSEFYNSLNDTTNVSGDDCIPKYDTEDTTNHNQPSLFMVYIFHIKKTLGNKFELFMVEDAFMRMKNKITKEYVARFNQQYFQPLNRLFKTLLVYIDENDNVLLLNSFEANNIRKFINFEESSSYEKLIEYLLAKS